MTNGGSVSELEQPLLYDFTPVLTVAPNWASVVDTRFTNEADAVDFRQGAAAYTYPQFTREVWRLTFLNRDVNESHMLQDIFAVTLGRLGEFYMPTGDSDFTPSTAGTASATSLRVKGQYFQSSRTRSLLWVELHTGEKGAHRVTGEQAVETPLGFDTLVYLSKELPRAVTGAEIKRISWLMRCRFASDTLTETFLTDSVSTLVVNVQTLDEPIGDF